MVFYEEGTQRTESSSLTQKLGICLADTTSFHRNTVPLADTGNKVCATGREVVHTTDYGKLVNTRKWPL